MNSALTFTVLLCIVFSYAVSPSGAFAEPAVSYAEQLYGSGSYFQCIDALRKESFYFGRDAQSTEYLITCCYFMGGQYKTVRLRLEDRGGLSFDASILLAKTYVKLGNYEKSYGTVSSLFYEGRDAEEKYRLLMSRLEPLLYSGSCDSLLRELEAYKKHNGTEGPTTALEARLKDYGNIPTRSPVAALTMSAVLPGLGQAYCGRFIDGFISLAGVCGAGAGGILLYGKGEKALSFGAFFFSALFYAGSLYGAYNGAVKFNALHRQRYRDGFIHDYMQPYEPAASYFRRLR